MAAQKAWWRVRGVRARATIVSVGTTVRVCDERPVLRLELAVRPMDGRNAYRAWVFAAPQYHLAQTLRPGVSGPVIVDPEDPARLVIDWDTAAPNIPLISDPVGGYEREWTTGVLDAAQPSGGLVGGVRRPSRTVAFLSAIGRHWPWIVLATGLALLAYDVAVVALAVLRSAPEWLLSLLSLGLWGPILLAVWWTLGRAQQRKRRALAVGEPSRASVESVRWAGAIYNGQRVLRIGLTVRPPAGGATYSVSIRNAPPFHLTELLQRGAWLPVRVDPRDPANVAIDWVRAERESSPDVRAAG